MAARSGSHVRNAPHSRGRRGDQLAPDRSQRARRRQTRLWAHTCSHTAHARACARWSNGARLLDTRCRRCETAGGGGETAGGDTLAARLLLANHADSAGDTGSICETTRLLTARLLAGDAGGEAAGEDMLAKRCWRRGCCPVGEALAVRLLTPSEQHRASLPCIWPAAQNSWKERDHQTYVLMTTN